MDCPGPEVRRSSGRVTLELVGGSPDWDSVDSKLSLPPIPEGFIRKKLDAATLVVGDHLVVDWVTCDVRNEFSY